MAQLCPPDAIRPWDDGAPPTREMETLEALRSGLPDDYLVLHGVHWSRALSAATAFGEIDFVVVNRSGRVLVIEQKNGPLEEGDDGLVKRYTSGPKRVQTQIQRSISAVREKFAQHNPAHPTLEIDYLIYCPDYRILDVNAAGVDAERVVDAAAKRSLPERVDKLLGAGIDRADSYRELVDEFFRQSFRIVPDVSSHIASQQRVYTRMTEGLADVVEKLELEPYRLRVQGTAGAGKTQLTLRFVDAALRRCRRPLLLCFNRPLADRLAGLAPKGTTVNTYLGFCIDASHAAGIDVEFGSAGPATGTWRDVQEQLIAADLDGLPKYDCLVVDEGQDFEPEWLEILQLFLTDDAGVLWLEDPDQNLRGAASVELPGFARYRETANFRTPQTIGRFIRRALDVDIDLRNPLPGLGVGIYEYDDDRSQRKLLAHRVNELVRQGFAHEEIAIVSCRGVAQAVFSNLDAVGSVAIRRFTGRYDDDGRQLYTDGKLTCDTIFRFKGQQAPAVILVDVDASLARSDRREPVLYCGMTRATVRLEMLVQSGSELLPALRAAV